MLRWLQRLLDRHLPQKRPRVDETDPIPLRERPVEWQQRHARPKVGDLLERKARDEIVPPRRPN